MAKGNKSIFTSDGGVVVFTGAGRHDSGDPRHHKRNGGFIFEYVLSGTECIESPKILETAGVGDLIIVNPSEECVLYSTTPQVSALYFTVDAFILEAVSEVLGLVPVFRCRMDLSDMFFDAVSLYGKYSAGDGEAGRRFTELAISILLRAADAPPEPDPEAKVPLSAAAIRDFLDLCICADVDLDDIGNEFGVSGMHIIRVFRGEFGTTPMLYLKESRLKRASHLLLDTDMSIREICDTLSFSTTQHFTNQFREMFGMSPGRYRETMRQNQ